MSAAYTRYLVREKTTGRYYTASRQGTVLQEAPSNPMTLQGARAAIRRIHKHPNLGWMELEIVEVQIEVGNVIEDHTR